MNNTISINSMIKVLILFVLFQVVLGTPAFGGSRDAKEYPATICLVSGPESSASYLNNEIIGGPYDIEQGSRYANCPLVRDKMSSNDGIEKVRVYVRKTGLGPLPWMWCRLLVNAPSNHFTGYTTYYSAFDMYPTTDSTGSWFQLSPKMKFPSRAYYSVKCMLPSEVAIRSITMTEKGY